MNMLVQRIARITALRDAIHTCTGEDLVAWATAHPTDVARLKYFARLVPLDPGRTSSSGMAVFEDANKPICEGQLDDTSGAYKMPDLSDLCTLCAERRCTHADACVHRALLGGRCLCETRIKAPK